MATNWPNSVQTFTNPSAGDSLNSPSHADQHTTVNDTVEALQNYAGLVFVKSVTVGSGVSSVTVSDAFNSTFDNYRLLINVDNSSTAGMNITLSSHASGSYYWSSTETSYAGAILCVGGAAQNEWKIGSTRSGNGTSISVEIRNPYKAEPSSYCCESVYFLTSGFTERISGWHNSTTSASSVTVAPSAGTLTGGFVRVYGYNNG